MNDIVYPLTDVQDAVFSSDARHRVWIAGRRSGKSYLGVVECLTTALTSRNALVWYIGPTFDDARDLAWEPLKGLVPPEFVLATHETRLSMTLITGSRIVLKSAEKPDRLRGRGLNLVVLDEFRWMDPKIRDVLRPALSDRKGRSLYITSPAGFNWSYDLYLKGQGQTKNWQSWQTTSLEGGFIDESEAAEAMAEMDPRMYRQEYLASFETLEGRVYSNFDRRAYPEGNVGAVAMDGGDLLIGMDFNVNPMSYVVAQKRGDECHVIAAVELGTSNTEEVAQHIRATYGNRRIVVCPDPSANQRRTSAPVGQTDITILQRHGFTVDTQGRSIPVVDKINNAQANLLAADKRRRVVIDPSCTSLIKALDGLTYKEGTNLPDKDSKLDHITDALGYLLWERFNRLHDLSARVFHFPRL